MTTPFQDLPLSPGQLALWYTQQLVPDNFLYVIPAVGWAHSWLDFQALQQACDVVVARHPMLRATFHLTETGVVQRIAAEGRMDFQVIDGAGWTPDQVEEWILAEVRQPFDLATGPLVRFHILEIAAEEFILIQTYHHIVIDFWSIARIWDELERLYAAIREGGTAKLMPLDLHYGDYVRRQQEMLAGPAAAPLWEYWEKQLAGELPEVTLPTDRPRPAFPSYQGATLTLSWSAELTGAFRALSRSLDVPLHVVALAAFEVLIYRYTGQSDLVLGTLSAGRQSDWKWIVGYFPNSLVLREQVSADLTFAELIRQAQQTITGAFDHQQLPFPLLVERLQPQRRKGQNPFFHLMFLFQKSMRVSGRVNLNAFAINKGGVPMRLCGADCESVAVPPSAQFDLTLLMTEMEDELVFSFQYAMELFDAATIERLAEHWQRLAEALVADPGRSIGCYDFLGVDERKQLLDCWNATATDYPGMQSVAALFEAEAARRPEASALVFGQRSMSYAELDARANQLAHYLRKAGVGLEITVGLCLPRSLEMVIGMLGVVKAGGVYVPLDVRQPPERRCWVLADAGVRMLLTQEALRGDFADYAGPQLALDTEWERVAGEPTEVPGVRISPDNLLYLIYTSGSTGVPKGVGVTHRGLVRRVKGIDYIHLDEEESWLQFTSLSFDPSMLEIWGALLNGSRLVLAPPGVLSMEELGRLIRESRLTSVLLPTGIFHQMVDHGLEDLAGVRQILVGGDVLSVTHAPKAAQTLAARVVNGYGPTENTVITTSYTVPAGAAGRESLPIGKPVAGTEVYVLDCNLQPVPVGVVGELYTGGAGLARGYWRRPGLTAERFIPHPFSAEPGARLYGTGDLVRRLPDGNLEFLGRGDHQVKVRGFRIELGEIEAQLRCHPDVRQAVVLARAFNGQDKQLVAYVKCANSEEWKPGRMEAGSGFHSSNLQSSFRDYLKARLPDYMVPTYFVLLESLPLTAIGKIDRQALPEPTDSMAVTEFVAPRTATEAALQKIWASVLPVKQIGIYDNFFELGGDSILSLQMAARARQAGLTVSPQQLMQYPTLAELALAVGEPGGRGAILTGEAVGPAPLTPIQRWFFDQELPDSHHYNQAVLCRLQPGVEMEKLSAALAAVTAVHPMLRARFHRTPEGWRQDILAEAPFPGVQEILLGAGESPAGVIAALQAGLNLSEGPIGRVAVLRQAPDDPGQLLWVLHHLVVDGVSWRILVEDLETAYRQLEEGRSPALAPELTGFKLWAERLVDYAQSSELQAGREYWRRQFSGQQALLQKGEKGDSLLSEPNTVASRQIVRRSWDAEKTAQLMQKAGTIYKAQFNELLVTALVGAVAQVSGRPEIDLDLEGHGRELLFPEVDLSRTVGWFTNLFPVRLRLPEGDDPGERVEAVKAQLRAVPHHGLGYGVLRYLGGELEAGRSAGIVFNYLGQLDAAVAGGSTLISEVTFPEGAQSSQQRRSHLLEVNAFILNGQLQIEWGYSRNLSWEESMVLLADRCLDELERLLLGPEVICYTPADFPHARLTEDELALVLKKVQGEQRVESLYELSPMQEAMLKDCWAPAGTEVYWVQLGLTFEEALDVPAFKRAWELVALRHAAFRTFFVWEGLSHPVQGVLSEVGLSWREEDWRGHAPEVQSARLAAFLESLRSGPVKLDQAPLMQWALLRLDEARYRLIWSCRHLVFDGWSMGPVFKELLAFYQLLSQGRQLSVEPAPHYEDYIAWLQGQDRATAECFWKSYLAGIGARRELPGMRGEARGRHQEVRWQLSAESSRRLVRRAREERVTLNTAVQGSWARLLSEYTQESTVVFGHTVSGRPAGLAQVEAMVGLFVNVVPVRVRVEAELEMWGWLRALQESQLAMGPFVWSSQTEIKQWCGMAAEQRLFETVFVFENYPTPEAHSRQVRDGELWDPWAYPLRAMAIPGEALELRLNYDEGRFERSFVEAMLRRWGELLEGMA